MTEIAFRDKMIECLYGSIDVGIEEVEEKDSGGSFVITFDDGSRFEVHMISIAMYQHENL